MRTTTYTCDRCGKTVEAKRELHLIHLGIGERNSGVCDRFNWDDAQIPLICFDQLEHFTKKQFVYMLARNRTSRSGAATVSFLPAW